MTPTELLAGLERDGILKVTARYVQTDEAIVSVSHGGSVGQLVEFLGVHRHLHLVAAAVIGVLYRVANHLSEDFHEECCRLGAKMRHVAIEIDDLVGNPS